MSATDLRLEVLMELSELPGVPGHEDRVREFVLRELDGLTDEVRTDALGNVIAYRAAAPGKGKKASPPERVMISAHMDEIGFLVRYVDDQGFLRVQPVGGFDPRNLFARSVTVHTRSGPLPGIMQPGVRPVHVSSPEDRKKVPELREFFIDLGLDGEESKRRVRIGDMVTLDQTARQVGRFVSGKAMDDRVGVFMLLELLRHLKKSKLKHDLYAVFSVQEEVGLRGAMAAAFRVEPTIGIGIDTTLAVDSVGTPPDDAVTRMGEGIGIKVFDSSMISTRWLVDQFYDLAQDRGIRVQLEVLPMGGNDAGVIQRSRAGVPSLTLSVPSRYVHTVVECVCADDVRAGVDLLRAYLA